jgi:ribA/ribD-fused uncharacterized protein
MSNFSPHPVTWGGKVYPTSEHLYQAYKFQDETLREKIRLADSPKDAAILGRSLKGMRADWDEIKIGVMKTILEAKLYYNPQLKQELLNTGDAQLVEYSSKDYFWGCGANRTGRNELGKLWMEIRSELRIIK